MTVRDAGLTQGWDLSGSPEDTRNLYASAHGHFSTGADTVCNRIDTLIYDGLCDNPDPSSSSTHVASYDIASEDENDPFGHGYGLA